jgi:hypothetical protein
MVSSSVWSGVNFARPKSMTVGSLLSPIPQHVAWNDNSVQHAKLTNRFNEMLNRP